MKHLAIVTINTIIQNYDKDLTKDLAIKNGIAFYIRFNQLKNIISTSVRLVQIYKKQIF